MSLESSAEYPLLEGLNQLIEWNGNETGLAIDPAVAHKPHEFRPLVRGTSEEVEVSLDSVLANYYSIEWAIVDPAGMSRAAGRDHQLRDSLLGVNELVAGLKQSNQQEQPVAMASLAVTEKVLEAMMLAAPYVPASVVKSHLRKLQGLIPDATTFQEFKLTMPPVELPSMAIPEEVWSKIFQAFCLLGLPLLPALFIYDQLENKRRKRSRPKMKRSRETGSLKTPILKDSSDPKAVPLKLYRRLQLDLESASPILDREYHLGQERTWQTFDRDVQLIGVEGDKEYSISGWKVGNSFMLTRLLNSYDPDREVLGVKSNLMNFAYGEYNHWPTSLVLPLGVINPRSHPMIMIPQLVQDAQNHRFKPWEKSQTVVRLELRDAKNDLVLDNDQLKPYVRIDGLSNVSLSLTDMPEEMQLAVTDLQAVLQTRYSYNNRLERVAERVPWIGKFSDEEQYKLNLYPPLIARFIEALQQKKARGEPRFQTNREIFSRLANFLGSYWLTYNPYGPLASEDDPVGFHETERVLNQRRASYEGANIALGQCMRFFLGDNDQIAYAEGYQLSRVHTKQKLGVGNLRDHRLKVVYQDPDDRLYFFDASPWTQSEYNQFKENSVRYKKAKAEWIEINKQAHQTLQIPLRPTQKNRIE